MRSGRIIGASKIARDITRQKRAEEALREQTRVLELLDATGRSIASQLDLQSSPANRHRTRPRN